ncbi:nicotinate phosphoribosyltransferase [Glutamicibacter sp. AOP38-B1-38]|uniref:nicotinate phosphoribosyltransferase n=1 Tax=Glutamicibacter sp. AOP38-B1-38 TaxID=3457680 RepID=UPI00403484A5
MLTSLFTDHYELTMLQAALASGAAHRPSVFEAFSRRLPEGRRYGVVAGTGRLLEGLKDFHFGDAQLRFLSDTKVVNKQTLDYLENFRFTGDITGYAEGELYFPHSPILTVQSTFAEACVIETYILSVLNHDSAIASAASRMIASAGTRPCIEMGSRRTHEESAVAAARAAIIAGFDSTSNLEAGARYGIKTVGTSAHSFTLLHDTEEQAFAAQIQSLGKDTTLLVDTYEVEAGVRTAVKVAGPELGGVRLDSGDLVQQAGWVRELLDDLGNWNTKITVTSDLDEYAIAALGSAPVDSYGVGTALVTGSGHPTASMVYKLVARQDSAGSWIPVAKASANKASVGGRKHAVRQLNDRNRATAEIVSLEEYSTGGPERQLSVPFVTAGRIDESFIGAAGVEKARARHHASIQEMPGVARKLQRGEPVIPTIIRED